MDYIKDTLKLLTEVITDLRVYLLDKDNICPGNIAYKCIDFDYTYDTYEMMDQYGTEADAFEARLRDVLDNPEQLLDGYNNILDELIETLA